MEALLKFASMLLSAKVGIATIFTSHDKYNPNILTYCQNKPLNDQALIIAHPKLPCGSKVWIYNLRTKLHVIAQVQERGPRHALLDTTIGVAKAIKLNGKEKVIMIALDK